MGESRWQVHGSTLLTDSAGASVRVDNNTQHLGSPFYLFYRSIAYPFNLISTHTHIHTYFLFLISMFVPADCTVTGLYRSQHRASFDILTFSSALSVLQSLDFSSNCLFCFHTSLSLSLCPSYCVSVCIAIVLLHYTHFYSQNTFTHAP